MNAETHPMQPFFDKHEGKKPEYEWRVQSMWAALSTLAMYADLSAEQLSMRTVLTAKYFPSAPVSGYMNAVRETTMNMHQLLSTVQMIDGSDWLHGGR
jgi:hypothetical protein